MTLDEAIKAVVSEAPADKGHCGQAKAYAGATKEAVLQYGTEGLKTQVGYMLSNLGAWRGERAREVKSALKAYLKKQK